MQCPRCRAENRESRRFCGECGSSFALKCPSCGFIDEISEKFCEGERKLVTVLFADVSTREHLTTATTMYSDMDMRFWLEQAVAEMKELG